MTANTTLNVMSGGDTVATDDLGTAKAQRIKLMLGATGVDGGNITSTNQLPASPDGTNDGQTFTGTLAAIGTFITLTAAQLAGMQSVNFSFSAAGGGCTLVVQDSYDGGTTWSTCKFYRNDVAYTAETTAFVNPGASTNWSIPIKGNGLRITLSAWTSGTYTIVGVIKRAPIPTNGFVNVYTSGFGSSISLYTPSATTANGAATPIRITAAASSGLISSGTHRVLGWNLLNTNAAVRYFHLYNKATAPTVGTDTPIATIPIGIGQTVNFMIDVGFYFSLGVGYAVTTDDIALPATAGAAGDIVGTIHYT